MPSTPPPESARRVGLREIAADAGVCLMTASLAMRDSAKISSVTKKRVREIAEKLGYRPDPEISRLMGRLRASRILRRSVVVAMFDLRPDSRLPEHPYVSRLRAGIARRADELGFGTSIFRLSDYHGDARALMRVVRSRGISAGILLPSDTPVYLDPAINWDGFAAVSATTSVLMPRFHRVVPNQLYNSMTLVAEMQRRGYSKIGAIFSESLEQRTEHYHSLVLAWHGHRSRILILPDASTPAQDEERIASWLRRHQVDLIFAQDADIVSRAMRSAHLKSKAGKVGLVSLSTINKKGVAFQDEQPEYIGESAVSLLAGMMHNNETGIPALPRVTTIDGVFRDGPTVRSPAASTTRGR